MYTVEQIKNFNVVMETRAYQISTFMNENNEDLIRWAGKRTGYHNYQIDGGIVEISGTEYGSRGYQEEISYSISLETFVSDDWKEILTKEIEKEREDAEIERLDFANKLARENEIKERETYEALKKKFEGE